MAVIQGTTGNDSLSGTTSPDTIFGLAGDDTINGLAGADLMIGGTGNDNYIVDDAGDQVIESVGEGTADQVVSTISYTLAGGSEIEFLAAGGAGSFNAFTQQFGGGAINLTGNEFAQEIDGNGFANVLDGGVETTAAADTLVGLGGDDTYIVRNASDVVVEGTALGVDTVLVVANATFTSYALQAANADVENLLASDATSTQALTLIGNSYAQSIAGNAGANVLVGNGGVDTLSGLGGNDVYNITSNTVVINDTTGTDTVNIGYAAGAGYAAATGAAGTYTITAPIETITAAASAGVAGINIVGGSIDQTIIGNDQANTITGGGGVDTLVGGLGGDTYNVSTGSTQVIENAGEGTDRVNAVGTSFYIGPNAEIEILALGTATGGATLTTRTQQGDGTFDLNALNTTATSNFIVGNNFSQTLYGDAGANILNGFRGVNGDGTGANADTLVGGAGNDTYRVYNQTDVVVEDSNGGIDFIYTSASYDLTVNDANAQAATLAGTGTNGATFLTGASQIEIVSAADQASNAGARGIDLTGNAYGNILIGDYGANILTGGGTSAGGQFDQLTGLRGNDTYNVNSRNTTVNENVGEGTDQVNVNLDGSGDSFWGINAASEVEFIYATGTQAISITGNEFAQLISGNAAANTLNGGGGADTLVGGAGSDSYLVTAQNQVIVEDALAAGANNVDSVFTTVSYDLAASVSYVATPGAAAITGGVQVEILAAANGQGTDNLNLTGNGYAQTIVGNYGNNVLDGDNDTRTGGNLSGTVAGDTLIGLLGNDSYRVYSQADVVHENAGEGTDTVLFNSATPGSYQLRNGTSVEFLVAEGNTSTAAHRLTGNDLAQTIVGNAGDNFISGREGNDTLTGGGGNDVFGFDTTLNATTNVDTITDFSAGDRLALGGTPFAALGATFDSNEFVAGTAATAANAQVLYDQATGNVFYDADGTGSGAAVLFANVGAGTVLGFNDFTINTTPTTAIAAA